jgi:heavy metal sensor kinase
VTKLPIRARLTLWYGALLSVALLVFAGAVYAIMASKLQSNLDASLRSRIAQLQKGIEVDDGRLVFPRGEEQTDEPLVPDVILKPSGRLFVGNLPAALKPRLTRDLLPLRSGINFGSVSNLRYAVTPVERGGTVAGYVVVWQSLQPVEDARHSLLWVLLLAGPLLLLLASAGGFVLARRSLKPVTQVTHTASAISAADLQARVPVSPARDEVSELASTFNAMLDRLQSGVERERRFAADASHELRSPLAVIRAEATLALDRPRQADEYRRVLQVVDEQAAAMEDLVEGLLLLARVETLRTRENAPIDVERAVAAAIALCGPALQESGVTVDSTIQDGLSVEGSSVLLTRAVRNLIENAVRVSPEGGTVRVRGRREADDVVVEVEDDGPGIAVDDQQHLFEPFFQVSRARTPGKSHGLGLAICRSIVEAHGGQVTLHSTPGHGALFRIILPSAGGAMTLDSHQRGAVSQGAIERLARTADRSPARNGATLEPGESVTASPSSDRGAGTQ